MVKDRVTVIIPVYSKEPNCPPHDQTNRDAWTAMAQRAYQSVIDQTYRNVVVIIYRDATNITDARNIPALECESDYIIFLDADDTMHPTYIEEMLKGTADIRVPSVHRHYPDGRIDTDQSWYQPKNLMTGNYIVVSAMIRTSLFKKLGGFHDYESLEDWDLWLRAEEAGATFEQIPDAILNVNKREGSRNSNKSFNEILSNAKRRRGIA